MSPLAPPYLPYLLDFTNESNHNNTDVSWLTKHSSMFNSNSLLLLLCSTCSAHSSIPLLCYSVHILSIRSPFLNIVLMLIRFNLLCSNTHAQHAHSVTIRDTEFLLLYTANTPSNRSPYQVCFHLNVLHSPSILILSKPLQKTVTDSSYLIEILLITKLFVFPCQEAVTPRGNSNCH